MTSLVQRFGRAARDPAIHGICILMAPPITSTYSDDNLRKYLTAKKETCRWTIIDNLFGNEAHTRNNCCDNCYPAPRPEISLPAILHYDPGLGKNPRAKRRSPQQKDMALQKLLVWRKETYEKWVTTQLLMTHAETWFMPQSVANTLAQKFSQATTAQMVKQIANNWTPFSTHHYSEVANLLADLNDDIDGQHGSGT